MTATPQYITNPERLQILRETLNDAYIFTNETWALRALQAAGQSRDFNDEDQDIPNNERLALLGDKLLDVYLSYEWIQMGASRKEFSDRRNMIASNSNLARIGRDKGLELCMVRNPGPQPVSDKRMATTVEAILGAVFLDAGKGDLEKAFDAVGKVALEFGLKFVA